MIQHQLEVDLSFEDVPHVVGVRKVEKEKLEKRGNRLVVGCDQHISNLVQRDKARE
jgi:hypothetical protein